MNLYLLRHGIAAEIRRGHSDAERPLTVEGVRKTWLVAESMEVMKVLPNRIFSSPLLRAQQTAHIIAEAFNLKKSLELTDALGPGGRPRVLVDLLRKGSAPEVLLVGHEPYLSNLAAILISGRSGTMLTMKKSGLCKLAVEGELKLGRCASLEWLLTPKQMIRMT